MENRFSAFLTMTKPILFFIKIIVILTSLFVIFSSRGGARASPFFAIFFEPSPRAVSNVSFLRGKIPVFCTQKAYPRINSIMKTGLFLSYLTVYTGEHGGTN
jgi:hypothetical protein